MGFVRCVGAMLTALICATSFPATAFAQCGKGTFNGFSVGLDAGLVRSNGTSNFDPPAGAFPASIGFSPTNLSYGPMVGGRFGYDVQCRAAVFGIEADWAYAPIDNSNMYTDPFAAPLFADNQLTITSTLKSMGTVRGRVGYEFVQNWLVYGTGGLAYGRVGHSVAFRFGGVGQPDTSANSDMSTKMGWTAGGGLEYAFGRWSVRGEALFVKLAPTDLSFSTPPPFGAQPLQNAHWDNAFVIARAGVTLRF